MNWTIKKAEHQRTDAFKLWCWRRLLRVPWRAGRSVQFSSVAQSSPTLCDPMNRSTPGLPVHHQLLEFTQTHEHRVSDAIQPSHPLSSPSPPAPNPSQHQGLCQWVNSLHEVAKVLEFQYNNHIYLRMYSGIKWQISTMQKLQLLLHQPNIVHPWRGKAFMCSSIFVAQVYVSFSPQL